MKKKKKDIEKIKRELTPKQKLFCYNYFKNNELFGNATLSYASAYGFKLDTLSIEAIYSEPDENGKQEKLEDSPYDRAYEVCKNGGNRLLTNAHIDNYGSQLLRELMTPDEVDSELSWVLKQRKDMSPKVAAIREYNRLKNRVKDNPLIISIDDELKDKNDKTLVEYLNGLRKNTPTE